MDQEFVTKEWCEAHRKYIDSRVSGVEGDVREIKVKLGNIETAIANQEKTATERWKEDREIGTARHKELLEKDSDRRVEISSLKTWIYRGLIIIAIGVFAGRGLDLIGII